ncbi:1,2-dihydroxy-3-keto-5-methylthiopentene dioxygenase [Pokkaliibacter sp. CJK22405]|uniref:1,2-dihydroxy-3-keto-5-methylthiopentene dioxygenase n=1 Tax=Pokkaliibacter sp. CJK22405 TaxID=3384615 RepID=UPI003984724D
MSSLTIYADTQTDKPLLSTDNGEEITRLLKEAGVRFERWEANTPITPGMEQDAILAAYAADIDRLKRENGYITVDVVSMHAGHPDKVAFRQKFLSEHRHTEDEVRFFVDGQGLFCLHIDDKIYQVLCCRNDLISVPENTPHWFDMGSEPTFTAIRLFNNTEGWVAHFTGSDIASQYPLLA